VYCKVDLAEQRFRDRSGTVERVSTYKHQYINSIYHSSIMYSNGDHYKALYGYYVHDISRLHYELSFWGRRNICWLL